MKTKSFKVLSLLIILSMVFSLAACTSTNGPEDNGSPEVESKYNAGTYTGTADGHNGEVKVEVEFSDTEILSVQVVDHSETAGISDVALERIPEEITEGQTLAVDMVSGATVTSTAILAAVEDAVRQAGGNVEELMEKAGGEESSEDIELTADVVVVGGGGAGLAAAASAIENGASVIVLEKQSAVGGSTALSGGAIAAPGSRFQEERGIEDSKELWMELWRERQATSNPEGMYPDYDVVDRFMDESIITTEWLVDYIGHEYGDVTGFGVDPAERLHFPVTDGSGSGGSVLIGNIESFLLENGVQILTETKATELVVDGTGDVVGVIAEGRSGKVTVNAKKVVLAAGGYAKSEELLSKYIPQAADTAGISMAAAGSTGDGIMMAEAIGAALYEEPWVIGLGVGTKVSGTGSLMMDWTKVYVDGNGERFANEQSHYAIISNKVLEQESPWVIVDSTEANAQLVETLEGALDGGEVVRAETYQELAEAMGVPAENFTRTMEEYNQGVKSGQDAFGKLADFLVPMEEAPYYAIKLRGMTMGTFAGVKTNENFEVVREDGSVINNLYAAGENANKVLYNQVYMSGSAVQFALTSGRLAAEHAVNNMD